MICEQVNLNIFGEAWLHKEIHIHGIFRSQGYVNHATLLSECLSWCCGVISNESFMNYDLEEIITLANFLGTFQVFTITIVLLVLFFFPFSPFCLHTFQVSPSFFVLSGPRGRDPYK